MATQQPQTALRIIINGRVQGVGFRYATVDEASRLGLTGWVRNTRDGRVEIVVQGPQATVQRLLSWCHRGPLGARVMTVEQSELPVDERLAGFRIVH